MSPPEAPTQPKVEIHAGELEGKSIPFDVIIDILSRLPVKSLIRFQLLSKSYKDAISDPRFSKNNFIHLSKSDNLFLHLTHGEGLFSLLRLDSDGRSFERETDLGAPFGASAIQLCSCNGVVLVLPIEKAGQFALWNPSIRKYALLRIPVRLTDLWLCYGLYYDSGTDDYKVVIISIKHHLVFSCIAKTWVEEEAIPCSQSELCHGVLVDGCFYWADHGGSRCFDLRERKAKELGQPGGFGLTTLWGHPCLRTGVAIWVREDCSWREATKMGKTGVHLCHRRQHIFFSSRDMSVHFRFESSFIVLGDCEKESEGRMKISGVESFNLVPCSESLFFPFEAAEDVGTKTNILFPFQAKEDRS